MNLTPEQREIGRDNYYSAMTAMNELHRRDFLKATLAGSVSVAGLGALYFGYQQPARPVRTGIIGTGDEGNVLIGALNPEFVELAAICDIRPSSIHRAFHGDWSSPQALAARPGLLQVYGWNSEQEARRQVQVFRDYRDLLRDTSIEAVIIALPLHLHAPVAVAAMAAGKHVLVEKLMAHNVAQCKLMGRVARQTGTKLSIGHQRHYNILYDNAVNLIAWGLLGEVHHIRAQWHRNNLPGRDSWAAPIPGGEVTSDGRRIDPIREELEKMKRELESRDARQALIWRNKIAQWEQWDADKAVNALQHGYVDDVNVYTDGRVRSALEELVRWRLWDRTGGGLMAELGSHQLDAASIFVAALGKQTGKPVHPLTVHALGGRHLFAADRDADDHVYCMLEYPGQGYEYGFPVGYQDEINRLPDPVHGVPAWDRQTHANKKIVVSYSSINGNGFGGWGEIVMGTTGTLVLEKEQELMLYSNSSTTARVGVKGDRDTAALDTSASGDPAPARAVEAGGGAVSRGYREEIEHWAWCIRQNDPQAQPRCNAEVGLADAVVALTTRLAIQRSGQPGEHGFVAFQPEWFDVDSDAVPETLFSQNTTATVSGQRTELGI